MYLVDYLSNCRPFNAWIAIIIELLTSSLSGTEGVEVVQ